MSKETADVPVDYYRLGDLLLGFLGPDEVKLLREHNPGSIGDKYAELRDQQPNADRTQLITRVIEQHAEQHKHLLPDNITSSVVIHIRLGDVMCGDTNHERSKRPLPVGHLVAQASKHTGPRVIIGKAFFATTSDRKQQASRELSDAYLNELLEHTNGTHFDSGSADLDLCCGFMSRVFVQGRGFYSDMIVRARELRGRVSVRNPSHDWAATRAGPGIKTPVPLSSLPEPIKQQFRHNYDMHETHQFGDAMAAAGEGPAGAAQVPVVFHEWLDQLHLNWSTDMIERGVLASEEELTPEVYPGAVAQLTRAMRHVNLQPDARVLVHGSVSPWVECMCIKHGFTNITTSDYNPRTCEHDLIEFINARHMHEQRFDLIISYSSLEHDGLGRYGDPINTRGAWCAMRELKHMLHDTGVLLLAVPVLPEGMTTMIEHNYHVLFGTRTLDKLFRDWHLIHTEPPDTRCKAVYQKQPVHVLRVRDRWYEYGAGEHLLPPHALP